MRVTIFYWADILPEGKSILNTFREYYRQPCCPCILSILGRFLKQKWSLVTHYDYSNSFSAEKKCIPSVLPKRRQYISSLSSLGKQVSFTPSTFHPISMLIGLIYSLPIYLILRQFEVFQSHNCISKVCDEGFQLKVQFFSLWCFFCANPTRSTSTPFYHSHPQGARKDKKGKRVNQRPFQLLKISSPNSSTSPTLTSIRSPPR